MPVEKPSRSGRRRITLFRLASVGAVVLVLAYMTYDVVFSDHGYLVYRQEKQQLLQLQAKVRRLEKQRERMAKQVLRLRNDPKALEELVHRELGYVHPDEYVLIFPKKKEKKP